MKYVVLKCQLKKPLTMVSYDKRWFACFSKFKGFFFDQNMRSIFFLPRAACLSSRAWNSNHKFL